MLTGGERGDGDRGPEGGLEGGSAMRTDGTTLLRGTGCAAKDWRAPVMQKQKWSRNQ